LVFVFVVSVAATYIAESTPLSSLGMSPLVIGLLFGALLANASHGTLPDKGHEGISFTAKTVLRLAIILYGFRLSLDQVAALGFDGVTFASAMLAITLVVGIWLGRALQVERHQSALIASGAAVCGASAVLSVETALKSEPAKATVAVATVIIFGTLFMFLLPAIYTHGALGLNDRAFAILSGSITHEVAQVAVISTELPPDVAGDAVLAKMVRVLLLPFVLIAMSMWELRAQSKNHSVGLSGALKSTPPYAIFFIMVVLINSSGLISKEIAHAFIRIDDFLLLLSMTAIGMETKASKLRQAGFMPFLLAALVSLTLLVAGWALAKLMLSH
jgi:uncharacterized integral membrane protein (TIGR00698 family)